MQKTGRQNYVHFFDKDSYIVLGKQRYKVTEILGKGQNGQVYSCKQIKQGSKKSKKLAIKVMQKEAFKLNPGDEKFWQREVEILKSICHIHILKYIDFQEDFKYFYLLTEVCEQGNLAEYIKKNGNIIQFSMNNLYTLQEKYALYYLKQLLSAFRGLQKLNIIHRDLKLENVLIDQQGLVKLGDFGFSRILRDGKLAETCCGSPKTMAPEISLRQSYNQLVDVYSLGIVLYQMLFGTFPYSEGTGTDNAALCKEGNMDLNKFGIQISEDTKQLLKSMIKYDPNQRITFEQLFQKFDIVEGNINDTNQGQIEKYICEQKQQQQIQYNFQQQFNNSSSSSDNNTSNSYDTNGNISNNLVKNQEKQRNTSSFSNTDNYSTNQSEQFFQMRPDFDENSSLANESNLNNNDSDINLSQQLQQQQQQLRNLNIRLIGENNSGIQNIQTFYQKKVQLNNNNSQTFKLKNNQIYKPNITVNNNINQTDNLYLHGYIIIIQSLQVNCANLLKKYINDIIQQNQSIPKNIIKNRIQIIINMASNSGTKISSKSLKNQEDLVKVCEEYDIDGDLKDIELNIQGVDNILLKLVKKIDKNLTETDQINFYESSCSSSNNNNSDSQNKNNNALQEINGNTNNNNKLENKPQQQLEII